MQHGITSYHKQFTYVFHHNCKQLEVCTDSVAIAAPIFSGLSIHLPASYTAPSNQFPPSTVQLPQIWPQRPSYPSVNPFGYTEMGLKNKKPTCS